MGRPRFLAMLLVSSLLLLSFSSHGMMWIPKFTIHSGIYSFSSKMHENQFILLVRFPLLGIFRIWQESDAGCKAGRFPSRTRGSFLSKIPILFSIPQNYSEFPHFLDYNFFSRKVEESGGRWWKWWTTLILSRTRILGVDSSWALLMLPLDKANNSQFLWPILSVVSFSVPAFW